MKVLFYILAVSLLAVPVFACEKEQAIVTAKIIAVEEYETSCKVFAVHRTVIDYNRHLNCGVDYSIFLSEGVQIPKLSGVCTLKVDDTLNGKILRDRRGTYIEP